MFTIHLTTAIDEVEATQNELYTVVTAEGWTTEGLRVESQTEDGVEHAEIYVHTPDEQLKDRLVALFGLTEEDVTQEPAAADLGVWTASNGKSITEHRLDAGMSRRELAEQSGLTQSRVWRIEHLQAFDTDGDRVDAATLMSAIRKFTEANPGGKPKKAAKTAAKSNVGAQLNFITQEIEKTVELINTVAIPGLKAKKVSTSHLVELSAHLRQVLEDAKQVTA